METKKRRITVRSAKARGRKGQDIVCKKLSEVSGLEYDNKDDNALIQNRQMGMHGTDIILRGEALKLFPLSIEVKNEERWDVPGAIRQAKDNQREGTYWMVVMKKNEYKKPVVIMDLDEFFDFVLNFKGRRK